MSDTPRTTARPAKARKAAAAAVQPIAQAAKPAAKPAARKAARPAAQPAASKAAKPAAKSAGKRRGSPQQARVDIHLTIAHVGFGGNAGGGRYFYSFAPDVVTVGESPITIAYTLAPDVGSHFKIHDVLTSDAHDQILGVKKVDRGRSAELENSNTVKTLIFFSVLVHDTQRDVIVACDPQVGNDPRTVPSALVKRRL